MTTADAAPEWATRADLAAWLRLRDPHTLEAAPATPGELPQPGRAGDDSSKA